MFSREFPQPINLLLDIVRLFNVYAKKEIRRTKKQWGRRHVFFSADISHSSVPHRNSVLRNDVFRFDEEFPYIDLLTMSRHNCCDRCVSIFFWGGGIQHFHFVYS